MNTTVGIFDRIVHGSDRFTFEEHCEFIRRDLENMFNAVQGWDNLPPYYKELSTSLATYGLRGFNSANLESHTERLKLLSSIKKTIEVFEPRLKDVQVTDLGIEHEFILRFGISAVLNTDNDSQIIQFGTTMNKYGSTEITK